MTKAELTKRYPQLTSTELAYLDGMSDQEQREYLQGRGFASDQEWADQQAKARAERERQEQEASSRNYCLADDGSHRPLGTLRRGMVGDTAYVEKCATGMLGKVDWVSTGIKADPGPFRTHRDPGSGTTTHKGDNGNYSKVEASLTVDLGWAVQYQKATVTYRATPYLWESVDWFGENNELAKGFEPTMKITMTLTGPDGAVVATEDITVTGETVPYNLVAVREFEDLPMGTYRVTVTGVKTGGRKTTDGAHYTGKDRVELGEHAVEFAIGS